MAASEDVIKMPGEYDYDGVPYSAVAFPKDVLDRVKTFKLDPSDVILVGYPKSGTTWTQEMVWLVLNDGNTERASQKSVWDRVPLIEMKPPVQDSTAGIDILESLAPPRIIKTHLQSHFFEKEIEASGCRVVYTLRNPKDQLVSAYHFYKNMFGDAITGWDQFFQLFRTRRMRYGDWFDHVTGWWSHHQKENVLFLKYEDMKRDHYATVKKMAKFFGKDLSEETLQKIVEHTTIKSMRNNPSTNLKDKPWLSAGGQKGGEFIRKGAVGNWKDYFTREQSDYMDEQCAKHLNRVDLKFEL